MHCGGCVGRIERALAAVPGVTEAAANLAAGNVTVHYDRPAKVTGLTEALRAAGYPADAETAVLDIDGMHCASCLGRVEAALAAVPGVLEARVNLAAETAHVRYLAGMTAPDALTQAAAQTGYAARARADESAPEDRRDGEIARLRRKVLIAAALALPVFIAEMGGHLIPAVHHWIGATIGHQTSWVIQFVLTSAVLFGPGLGFYRTGFPALFRGAPDMNSLVALGTSAAYGYSVVATFTPGLLPAASRAVYFEAAAVIVVLILVGRWMEARAKGRTGAAIRRLVGLQPKTARVRRGAGFMDMALADVRLDDLIQVRPGERVATDGEVVEGRSFVDEAMISGEPTPVPKAPGDAVVGGTVNGAGAFVFRATAVGRDTVLAQIVRMVEEAQAAKLPIQGLVDRITLWFVPAVSATALLTVLIWLALGPSLTHALVAGVSVLIIACPCAMGLATPTSIMVGTGRGAELGVLFRKGDALQRLQEARVVAFDKTGTLTEGRPDVTDFVVADGVDADIVLATVAGVEALSEHPLAAALVRAAESRGLAASAATGFASVTGQGARAIVDGEVVLVGAARLMDAEAVSVADLVGRAAALAQDGKTVVYAAIGGRAVAVFGVTDPVKPSSRHTVATLRAKGLQVAMITGDAQATAQAIAADLKIDHVVAEVLPEGKVDAVRTLKEAGPVAFVGDGINDAPALAEADIGIAIGTGTDIAVEAADVVLASGDPAGVVNAVAISRATLRNIRQNLVWAFGYNVLLIPVAAGLLYPSLGLLLSPMLAAGAMALSSVAVLSNALRLRWIAPETVNSVTPNASPSTLSAAAPSRAH